eukprot:TRINITY_DN221_c0_g1_i1.p1 TRINITY_DN221_c0_g1~~TRINITY_DN221_c0_g1_i1.p1  ORF type:complete len:149 (-),score=2.43 TRINITY_DN221_c0_g1_i1:1117-1563(-)
MEDRSVMEAFKQHKMAWETIGTNDPWWSILLNMEMKGKDPTDDLKNKFYLTGITAVQNVYQKYAKKNARNFTGHDALDFGCGVGRLSFALSPFFDNVACVDQSAPHLQVVETEAKKRGFANIRLICAILLISWRGSSRKMRFRLWALL